MSMSTTQFSPEEARRFDHFSIHNAVAAEAACPTHECRAYTDIFTFRRWLAQGYAVKKGERGTKVTTWIPRPEPEDAEDRVVRRKKSRTAVVYCRHQVESRDGRRRPRERS